MAWDPSIALQGNKVPLLPNPLEFLGNLEHLQQRKNQNLLFQQQNDARVATGQAYSQAIGQDGTLDEIKLLDLAKRNSNAQFMLPEILAAAQAREKERQAIQDRNLALAQQRIGMFANTLGGLVVHGDKVTQRDVYTAVSKLITQVNDPELAKTIMLGLKDLPADSKGIQEWITKQNVAVLGAKDRLELTHPQPFETKAGGSVEFPQINRLTGGARGTASVEVTPTPGEMNAPGVPRTDTETGAPKPPLATFQERPMVGGKGTVVSIPPQGVQDAPSGIAPAKQTENIKTMEDFWSYREDLNKNLSSGEAALQQMESMRNLMQLTRTGAGQETRMKVAGVLSALGLDDLAKTAAGGDYAAAQEFAKKSFQSAYESLKLMSPPGTQLTQGEVLTNWENSARLSMDPRAVEGLFNFATKVFKYKQEEREFYRNWEGKPAEARAAWTDEALKRKLITPETRDRGAAPGTTTPRQGFSRGPGVPPIGEVPDAELNAIPDGRTGTITLDNGTRVRVKRTGTKFEVLGGQ